MPTLTSTTIRSWITRLNAVIENCNGIVDSELDVPSRIWHANRNARTAAVIVRDELLELAVSAVEVEQV